MDQTDVFEAERPRLVGIAGRVLADHAEAQEIVQQTVNDPADEVALADTVGLALHVVLNRLSPRERVAFVLHDSFGPSSRRSRQSSTPPPRPHAKWPREPAQKSPSPVAKDALTDLEVVDTFDYRGQISRR